MGLRSALPLGPWEPLDKAQSPLTGWGTGRLLLRDSGGPVPILSLAASLLLASLKLLLPPGCWAQDPSLGALGLNQVGSVRKAGQGRREQ